MCVRALLIVHTKMNITVMHDYLVFYYHSTCAVHNSNRPIIMPNYVPHTIMTSSRSINYPIMSWLITNSDAWPIL